MWPGSQSLQGVSVFDFILQSPVPKFRESSANRDIDQENLYKFHKR